MNENEPQKSDSTVKTVAAPTMNEKEYAQYCYDRALQKMIANPTKENREAFEMANTKLFMTLDAYNIGARLLLERARRLQAAFRGIIRR